MTRALGGSGATIDLLQFHAWRFSIPAGSTPLLPPGAARGGPHTPPGRHQLRHRPPAHRGRERDPVVSNQVAFSLLDRRAAGLMSEFCLDHGVSCSPTAASPEASSTERWLGPARARLGPARDLVGDEVRAVHPGGRRLGAVPGCCARRWRGGAETRRLDGERRLPRRPRRAGGRRRSSWARGSGRASTSRTTGGCSLPLDDRTARSSRGGRGTRCPFRATAATSTASRPFSRPRATSATTWSLPSALPDARAGGRTPRPERDRLGAARRLFPGRAPRRSRIRSRNHRHAWRSGDGRDRRGGPAPLRHRQDRGRPPVARWAPRGRGAHAGVRAARPRLGGRGPRARRALPHILPANTLVQGALVSEDALVEIEAEAEL